MNINQYSPMIPDLFAQINRFIKQIVFNYPSIISIEISKACNRRCSYCPQSITPLKQEIMSDNVWESIKIRLVEAEWKGLVGYVEYNELALVPNSQKYISDLVKIGCLPVIYTNGDKPEVVKSWIDAGAYRIVITQHPPTSLKWEDGVEEIKKYAKSKNLSKIISVRRIENPDNRGGRVEGTPNKRISLFSWFPWLTFTRCWVWTSGMNIRIDGSVSICCVDYSSETNFGSVLDYPIWKVWNGKLDVAKRKSRKGIPATKICVECLK